MKHRQKTKELAICALFTALIATGAFIKIPVPYFDYFTLQFLMVLLAGLLLGSRLASTATTLYVGIGLFGIPIFAGGGGIGYIVTPSFGYLLGFIACAYVTGKCMEQLPDHRTTCFIAVTLGLVVTYAIGLAYKYMILRYYVGESVSLALLWLSCFPIDLPGDLMLAGTAAILAKRLSHVSAIRWL